MSKVIKSRHSSHRWRTQTSRRDEQSRNLPMQYHGHGSLFFYRRVCAQINGPSTNVIYLSQFSISKYFYLNNLFLFTTAMHCVFGIVTKSVSHKVLL